MKNQVKLSLEDVLKSRIAVDATKDIFSPRSVREGLIIIPNKSSEIMGGKTIWVVRDYENLCRDIKSLGYPALEKHLNEGICLDAKMPSEGDWGYLRLFSLGDLGNYVFNKLVSKQTKRDYIEFLRGLWYRYCTGNPLDDVDGSITSFEVSFKEREPFRAFESQEASFPEKDFHVFKLPEVKFLGNPFRYYLDTEREGGRDCGWWTNIIHGLEKDIRKKD